MRVRSVSLVAALSVNAAVAQAQPATAPSAVAQAQPTTAPSTVTQTQPTTTPKLPTPWSLAKTPAAGEPHAIGGYSAGCIEGAIKLPLTGDGFRVARPERGRVFGHPLLVGLIREL